MTIIQIFLHSTRYLETEPNGEFIGGKKKKVIYATDLNYSLVVLLNMHICKYAHGAST